MQASVSLGKPLMPQLEQFFLKRIDSAQLEKCVQIVANLNERLANSLLANESTATVLRNKGHWTDMQILQLITGFAVRRASLRDEIYCQICKQIQHDQGSMESCLKGWVLLCVCLGVFAPSERLHDCLQQMIEENAPTLPLLMSCRARLSKCADMSQRECPLSQLEYQMLIRGCESSCSVCVHLMDSMETGSAEIFKFNCHTTVHELFRELCHRIRLQDVFGFAIFLLFDGQLSPLGSGPLMDVFYRCEQYIQSHIDTLESASSRYVKMQHELREAFTPEDVVLNLPWNFIIRKQIFAPWHDPLEDPVASNLICCQLFQGLFQGHYAIASDSKLAYLLALRFYVSGMSSRSFEMSRAAMRKQVKILLTELTQSGHSKSSHFGWSKNLDLDRWTNLVIEACVSKKLFTKHPSLDTIRAELVRFTMNEWSEQFSKFYPVLSLAHNGEQTADFDCELFLKLNHIGLEIVQNVKNAKIAIAQQPFKLSAESQHLSEHSATDRALYPANLLTIETLQERRYVFSTSHAKQINDILVYILNQLKTRSNYVIATNNYGRKRG
ncbi:Unconventional myosin-VIIb [Cichlidogyrus casuarinus]|uniref:Unconventional myosin-VIIb n=1 Tax=Cichlidogyrus casuarinus TaxID=1844966 RepID=A0ABD2QKF6_9PLAT